MAREEKHPEPLTFDQVRELTAMPPEVDPPKRFLLSLATFTAWLVRWFGLIFHGLQILQ